MLRRLYPYMRPCMFFFYLSIVFLLVDLGGNIVIPWVIGQVIDLVLQGEGSWQQRSQSMYSLMLYLISGFVALSVAVYIRGLSAEWFSQQTVKGLRTDLFVQMQKLDMGFYHRNTVGELMSRITSDVEQVRNYCAGSLMMIVWNLIFFPLAAAYMLYLNWRLTLLCLLLSPLIALLAARFSAIGKRNQQYNRQAYARLSAVAQESLNGIRLIQNFMSQKYETQRFAHKNHDLTKGRQRSLRNWAKYMPILEALGSSSNILALTVGGYMVIRGEFSLGTWVQFTGYTWMIVAPMRQLGDLINISNFARISSERIFTILDQEQCIRSPKAPYIPSLLPGLQTQCSAESLQTQPPQGRGEIEFAGVSWDAADRAAPQGEHDAKEDGVSVLRDIDLKIPAGSSLGIVGETGAGKTSLADLICRFADPSKGCIRMDGVDLRQWELRILRAQISYVMQEPFLFSETLSYNISFNQPSISQDKVIRSAQRSAAHGFIDTLQQGYQTVVGERGVGLSGGQRQRTALARALVKEAPILILDDTTSAVDMETEKDIQQQLQRIDSHHTRIIIAHRLSSVMDCEQIIVMQEGQIVERGDHRSLLAAGGYYAQVFASQQGPAPDC